MSDKASAQQDLLKELYNYSATIIPGTETLIAELRHNRQSDTDELFNLVIQESTGRSKCLITVRI